jgi:hypothetical protein
MSNLHKQMPAPQLFAAQVPACIACELAPHIWKHGAKTPPFFTQAIPQESSMLQIGSSRHASASAQHLLAIQSPHAVPSVVHWGGPQTPALH